MSPIPSTNNCRRPIDPTLEPTPWTAAASEAQEEHQCVVLANGYWGYFREELLDVTKRKACTRNS